MFIFGGFIFAIYEHLPPLDALLASVSTITTIGLYVPNGGNFLTLNRSNASYPDDHNLGWSRSVSLAEYSEQRREW
jgi:hypothetical protein